MTYMVSREAAGSAVAFFDSMHNRLAELMDGAPIAAPRARTVSINDAQVRDLVAAGHRLDEICRRCGCSTPVMRSTLRRLGLFARGMHGQRQTKRTKERRARGMAMLASGATITDVARACGVTKPSVMKWRMLLSANNPIQQPVEECTP